MKLNPTERAAYESYLDDQRYENSLTEGNYNAGKAVGRFELATAMVKKCYAKGMGVAETADLTGLTEEEVKNIISG
jgi:hypothetical protein